jgi:hypothetical protein
VRWTLDCGSCASTEARRYPSLARIADALGDVSVSSIPIPLDCVDGFNEAYYGRPEMLLDPRARTACSAWSFVARETAARYVEHLARDLADGTWNRRYGHLRRQSELDGSLVLVVSPGPASM